MMSEETATAKHTRAALKRHVLPLLRDHGFTDGTPSKLWRHRGDHIEIVELSCFSAYRAQTDRTTTASFDVRLGRCLPGYSALCDPFQKDHIKQGPDGPRPAEAQMPIRGMICPSSAAAMEKRWWGWEINSTWQVETVQDASDHAADLAVQFEAYGLDWLRRDWDPGDLLEILKQDATAPFLVTSKNGSYLRLAAETKGSPVRQAHVAMLRAKPGHGRLP